MTDESYPPGDQVTPEPMPADEHDTAKVLEGAGDFTSGEGLVAFAGMAIVAVWVIFSILTTEYFIAHVLLILSVTAAVTPRLDRSKVERLHPVPVIMKALGYGIAFMGLVALVEDIRFEAFDEVWAIIGGVITYAAAVAAFIGARQIES
jgi:hypothetical protein